MSNSEQNSTTDESVLRNTLTNTQNRRRFIKRSGTASMAFLVAHKTLQLPVCAETGAPPTPQSGYEWKVKLETYRWTEDHSGDPPSVDEQVLTYATPPVVGQPPSTESGPIASSGPIQKKTKIQVLIGAGQTGVRYALTKRYRAASKTWTCDLQIVYEYGNSTSRTGNETGSAVYVDP